MPLPEKVIEDAERFIGLAKESLSDASDAIGRGDAADALILAGDASNYVESLKRTLAPGVR